MRNYFYRKSPGKRKKEEVKEWHKNPKPHGLPCLVIAQWKLGIISSRGLKWEMLEIRSVLYEGRKQISKKSEFILTKKQRNLLTPFWA